MLAIMCNKNIFSKSLKYKASKAKEKTVFSLFITKIAISLLKCNGLMPIY